MKRILSVALLGGACFVAGGLSFMPTKAKAQDAAARSVDGITDTTTTVSTYQAWGMNVPNVYVIDTPTTNKINAMVKSGYRFVSGVNGSLIFAKP